MHIITPSHHHIITSPQHNPQSIIASSQVKNRSVVVLGVEGGQCNLHHLELLIVLLLLLHLVVHVEQLHVVLPKRSIATVPQRRTGHRSEVVRSLGLAGEGVLALEVELLLVNHGVSLLHVLARPRHLALSKLEATRTWERLALNLSSLAMTPSGFFLSTSEEAASVWQAPGPGGVILEASSSGFFSSSALMLQCIAEMTPVFFWLVARSRLRLQDPGPILSGECSLRSCGRGHLERKTGLSFSAFLRRGQEASSNFTTSALSISSSGFYRLRPFSSLRISSSKNVRGDRLLKTDCAAFYLLARPSRPSYWPGPSAFLKDFDSLNRSSLAQLELEDSPAGGSGLQRPGPTYLLVPEESESLPALKIHWCSLATSPSPLPPRTTLQSSVCFSRRLPSQAPGPGVSYWRGTKRCARERKSGFPLSAGGGARGWASAGRDCRSRLTFIILLCGGRCDDRFTYKRKMVDRLYEAALEARPAENPLSDPATKNKLIRSLYGQQGFAKQHIDSYDEFVNFRISEIILSKMNRRVLSDSVPSFWLEYTGIRVAMPTFEKNYDNYSRVSALYPHEARTSDLSYSADIFVDVRYSVTGAAVETRRNVKIGRMPVMVGSSRCHLRGRNERELAQLQECPYDPRGYFIINGTEKVLLIQEQMIENRILVERHPKLDSVVASVVSYTIDTKTMCELQAKNGRMYVRCGSFSELVPVFVLFKAFGMECDQEVFQLVNCTDQLEEYLVLSLEDCHKHGVFTTEDAVEYLSKKLWKKNFESKRESRPKEEVRQKLANILLVHVPVAGENLLAKAQYLALMMKKLIEGINDPAKIDNRDYYGNKRMKCAGTLLELLFEDRFKVFNNELREELNKFLLKHKDQRVHELSHLMESRCGIITHGLHSAIATGNWNIKRFHIERKGVSQQLSRISFISAIGMITRLNSQFEKTRKIAGPRALLGSHWGMICPCDTPDGEGCGLVKNLALTTCITTSCRAFKYKNLGIIEGNLSLGQGHRVILDGIVVGYTFNARLVDRIRLLRRRGLVEKFVNVAMIKGKDEQFGEIMINTDSGRLVRPLLILERGRILLTKEMVRELDEDRLSFDDLVGRGVIEFLDVNEEDNALIAVTAGEITVNHTHLEIDPFTIIGVVAGIIPYPHHNQSPRNLFQCSMGKQAQGIIGLNELVRNDTLNYLLSYPQQPLVKTAHIELINYNRLPAGQNASVAVMSYSGYDIEDAIIVNRAALDRGFERSFYYRRYENELKKHGDYGLKDTLVGKEQELKASERKNLSGFFLKKYGCLDEDGLAKVGRNIQGGEVYVNKKVPVVADAAEKSLSKLQESIRWNDEPSTFKSHSQNNYVDRVILTSNDQNTVVKTITREMRRPELGDKLSSRHGQKGVCGLIVPEEDMPFSETGWRPDLIMNPHGYPSRMTVGKLMELIGGKAGCLKGRLHSGTAFAGDRAEDLCRVLTDHGFSYTGKDTLISGTTGEYLSCYVFSGPIFYQRLKHMVADKIHARSTGKVTVLTRQPTEGRSKEGGLRLGEMERDCLLGFGASDLLLERLLFSSDDSTVLVCELCGFFQHGKRCESCRKASAYRVKMPYACKLLFQELISMGIRPKINLGKIDDNPFKEDPPKQAKAK